MKIESHATMADQCNECRRQTGEHLMALPYGSIRERVIEFGGQTVRTTVCHICLSVLGHKLTAHHPEPRYCR